MKDKKIKMWKNRLINMLLMLLKVITINFLYREKILKIIEIANNCQNRLKSKVKIITMMTIFKCYKNLVSVPRINYQKKRVRLQNKVMSL